MVAETKYGMQLFPADERKLVSVSQSLGRGRTSHRTVTVSRLCRIMVPARCSAPLPTVALTASMYDEPG